MNRRIPSLRPTWSAWFVIMGVTLIAVGFAVASALGVIATDVAKRLIGLAFGLMTVLIGNSLPKLRPFNWMGVNATSASVERLSGWILVSVGVAWLALFALVPVYEAKRLAALIGFGALVLIGVSWVWLARMAWDSNRRQGGQAPVPSGHAAARWRAIGWLLFAFFYVFVIACAKFLVDQKQLANEVSMWISAGMWLLYAAAHAAFGRRRTR